MGKTNTCGAMKKQILFLIFVIGNILAYSQTCTLPDCINYAYAHRTELQKQETAQGYYNKNLTYMKYRLLPSVSGNGNYQFISDRKNQSIQSATAELASELVLFNGFQIFNSIKQSELLKNRNKTHTEKIRNDIKLEVTEIYYTLLLAQENIKIFENSIQSAEQQISLITEAVKAGRISNVDLLEMQAQLEKERSNKISLVKQYERDFIRLKKAMNYTEGSGLKLPSTEAYTEIEIPQINVLFLSAIATLPEFQLARQDSLFAVYDLKRVKGQYSPYLSLSGSLGNQLDDNFTKKAGVSLSIPIYSRHEIRRQQIEKQQQLSYVNLDNKQLYQDIYFEIERIWQEIIQNQESLKSAGMRFDFCKQIYEIRFEQYRHGTLSVTDLLVAENNMKNAEIELNYVKYNLQYNTVLIQHFYGKMDSNI